LFLSHALPLETGYIIFIKYVILGKGLSKKLKKKRIITQQYISYRLINKYNKDIDNIFIGDFKSVFMGYNIKDVFFLDASIASTTGTGDGVASLDISAYVQPIARKGMKATGLAIYKVHWDIAPAATNSPNNPASTGVFRAALMAGSGLTSAAVGSASIVNDTLKANNDLIISGVDCVMGGTAAGDPWPHVWLEPSIEVPYVIVRDSVHLMMTVSIAVSSSTDASVRLECAQITLDQATLNQLLRTQTV